MVELACFLDHQHVAAFVCAALGAGAMGQLTFVTIRALGEADRREGVVGATLCGTGPGVTPFGIRHCKFPFLRAPRAANECADGSRNFLNSSI